MIPKGQEIEMANAQILKQGEIIDRLLDLLHAEGYDPDHVVKSIAAELGL